MAEYENVKSVTENRQNLREYNVNTTQTSTAVSNELYGALILEPTIRSSLPDFEPFDDLDDFWLDLAKTQTLKQKPPSTSKTVTEYTITSDTSLRLSETRPKTTKRHESSRIRNFVEDTDWVYSPGRIDSGETDNNLIDAYSNNVFDFETSDLENSSQPTPAIDTVYEVANAMQPTPNKEKPNRTEFDDNDNSNMEKRNANGKEDLSKTQKYNTIPNTIYEFATVSNSKDFSKTNSLNYSARNQNSASVLGPSTLYESVDNLSVRDPQPIPKVSPLQWKECSKNGGYFHTDGKNDEPVYAKVTKRDKGAVNARISASDAEFDSLATERVTLNTMEQGMDDNSRRGLGLDYTYAKVNKPKRYANWPLSESIKRKATGEPDASSRVLSNNATSHPEALPELIYEDPEDMSLYYSSVEDMNNERIDKTDDDISHDRKDIQMVKHEEKTKTSFKTKVKGLFTNVKNKSNHSLSGQKSSFYPFSFIFSFKIQIDNKNYSPVKTILPQIDGKCWLICENDFKIRLYDSQGQQLESLHIGIQGSDMAFDNSGHLFVSCESSKRIFMIDTRHLCMMSKFVDSELFPKGLAFDSIDNTLIVCQSQQNHGLTVGVAPIECLQKYTIANPSQKWNVTSEQMFSHPTRVSKNANSDIIVSDAETNALVILNNDGRLKSMFNGNDVFKMHHGNSFVCDIQSNILIISQEKHTKAGKSCDNACLIDESGDLINTFFIDEIKNQVINSMAITDHGFLWISGENGIFIFDYQIL